MIAPVGKSGPLTCFIRSSTFASGLSISVTMRVDDLAEVVRRDVRRHPDRDAGAAVDEQVREPGRQDERLALRLVVVRAEVDGVGVELAQHLLGELREARLGVAHRGRRIVVDRAEVALAVDERIAQRERLRHAARACRRSTRRRAGDGCPSRSRRCSRSSRTAGPGRLPFDHIEKSTRRCTGFRPSRTSGSARETMTCIA